MLGMRFTFHTDILRQPLIDGRYDWVWGEMEKGGIPAVGPVPSRIHALGRQAR
jgi:L-fuconolactonase